MTDEDAIAAASAARMFENDRAAHGMERAIAPAEMSDERTMFVATKNAGKMTELRELFAGSGWKLATYDDYEDVVEGESSYAENAALKATALARQLRSAGITAATLGDDSGLEVLALGGRPGVLSARYGGVGATWADRRRLLRVELAAVGGSDRRARFVCALHFISETGEAIARQRDVWGEVSYDDAGASGFSYDPMFWYAPADKTFAELADEEKNRVSHRGLAVEALLTEIGIAAAGNGKAVRPGEGNQPAAGM